MLNLKTRTYETNTSKVGLLMIDILLFNVIWLDLLIKKINLENPRLRVKAKQIWKIIEEKINSILDNF